MRTRYSEDQQAVQEAFGDLFAREATPEAVRAAETDCGFDRGLWDKLAAAGALGIALPEELEGGGASLVDLAVVVYEWGRRIAPVPLVEHAVAARLLASASTGIPASEQPDDDAPDDTAPDDSPNDDAPDYSPSDGADALTGRDELRGLAAAAARGEAVATLALRPPDADGVARLVPAGAVAHLVVALSGEALIVGRGDPPGANRPNTADLPLADRDLSHAAVVAEGFRGVECWERALAEWRALTAVAYTGLGQEALDMGTAYVKERHQFGVPVGSFQAVQHGLADAATRVEGARLLAFRAVCSLDARSEEGHRLASMALLFAAESARFATDRALQYHGGYGYSAEYDVQLYYRRAAAWMLQLGGYDREIARLADAELGPKSAAT